MNAKTILGILTAAAVGIAVGMLIAPQKGSDLQKSLKDSVDDLGDQLGDMISEGKEKLMGEKEQMAGKTNELKKEFKHTADPIQPAKS